MKLPFADAFSLLLLFSIIVQRINFSNFSKFFVEAKRTMSECCDLRLFSLCVLETSSTTNAVEKCQMRLFTGFFIHLFGFFLAIHCGLRLPEHSFQSQGTFLIRNAYELSNVLLH